MIAAEQLFISPPYDANKVGGCSHNPAGLLSTFTDNQNMINKYFFGVYVNAIFLIYQQQLNK